MNFKGLDETKDIKINTEFTNFYWFVEFTFVKRHDSMFHKLKYSRYLVHVWTYRGQIQEGKQNGKLGRKNKRKSGWENFSIMDHFQKCFVIAKNMFLVYLIQRRLTNSGIVVKHLLHHPKVEGLSPATSAATGR